MIALFRLMVVLALVLLGTNATPQRKAIKSARFAFYNKLPAFVSVPLGDNAAINCTTNGFGVTTELLKDGVSLPSERFPLVTVVKNGDVFTIVDFGISDSGQYKCRATDSFGTTIQSRSSSWLMGTFSYLPSMSIDPPFILSKLEGESANFTCKSALHTDLSWYKGDGRAATKVPDNKVATLKDSSVKKVILMIKNAQLSDSGTYKCVLTSLGKQKYELAALQVLEKIPAKVKSFKQIFQEKAGRKVQLRFTIDGYPTPQITWYKKNKEILTPPNCNYTNRDHYRCQGRKYTIEMKPVTDFKRYNVTLTISNLTYPNDNGLYYLKADNVTANVNVLVFAPPVLDKKTKQIKFHKGPPYNIKCKLSKAGNPHASITWEKKINNGWITISRENGYLTKQKGMTSIVYMPHVKTETTYYRCTAKNTAGKDAHIITYWT